MEVVDWSTFWTIVAILGAGVLGAWANHWAERRPRLVTFISHTAALKAKDRTGSTFPVHTHSMVVQNLGRKTAKNVRLGHLILPDYNVYPSIPVTEETLPDNTVDLVIPLLRPKEQFTVSYLYYPPTVWNQINSHVKSDEDSARVLNVMPTRQASKRVVQIAWFLMFAGAAATLYALVALIVEFILPMVKMIQGQ